MRDSCLTLSVIAQGYLPQYTYARLNVTHFFRERTPMAAPQSVASGEGGIASGGFATIDQAARFLSLSRATVYNLMDGGELPWAKFGRARRIPWDAIRAYGAKNLVAS
jgi:excisionase family DNA binding protein